MKKTMLALVLAVAMVLTTLCGAAVAEESKDLVLSLVGDVATMYVYSRGSNINNQVLWHPYEALISKDADMNVIPLLAESWETSEDGLTWTFHLRQGVKFHDGSDFTAEDVIASYDKARVVGESLFVSNFRAVESYEALDDYTVAVHLNYVQPLLLDDLMFVCIAKKEDIEGKTPQEIAENINGTGRYKFVEYVPEDHIDFTVNTEYWGEIPEATNVRFRPIANVATRTASLLSGELDVACMLSFQDVDRIEATEGVYVAARPSLECVSLQLLQTDKNPAVKTDVNPLQDVRVRKAMYQAIDVQTIIDKVFNGHAYYTASMVAEGFNGYNPDLERFPYDPEAAKELLAEAGYPDGFEIVFDAGTQQFTNSSELAQAVAGYWEKIGIKVTLNLLPTGYGAYTDQEAGNSGLMLGQWAMYTGDGISMQEKQYYTWDPVAGTGAGNNSQYSNPEVDALIDEAISEPDDARRAELVKQIDKIVTDDVANIPLFFNENIFGVSDDLEYKVRYDRYLLAWEISFR